MNRLAIRYAALTLLTLLGCSTTTAEPRKPTAPQSSPVTYQHILRRDPNFSIHVVTVDLSDPRVDVEVSRGGPDPDGPQGAWLTTLQPTTEIAKRENYDIAINGDFFGAQNTKDIEGKNTGFVKNKPASPVGYAMTDGTLWHRAATTRPYLAITSKRTAVVGKGRPDEQLPRDFQQMIGGSHLLVKNGKPVETTGTLATARHPRTVAGFDATGTKLTLLVVDGRQKNLSIGMTYADLAKEMIDLGCTTAINLDGGGSSTLVWRDPTTKQPKVLNSPSDTKERSVADVLGIRLRGGLPSTQPAK